MRAVLALLLVPLAVFAAYVGVASALMFWPTPRSEPVPVVPAVEGYVLSNGVHTDYVFPVRAGGVDWSKLFLPAQAPAVPADADYIAIGWGDRDFYLNTPTWADLTPGRAVGALLGGNRSLLHVTWLRRNELGADVWRLPLSAPQYARLVDHVRAALPRGQAVPIAGAHYGPRDAFYEALGSYHLFETCNTWTGRGLRDAGVPTGRWTPFDFTVVRHLQRSTP
ncbi:MAG: TIGR02117 family protein [Comamonadaceae bacterium]|nr:MAG: TIGR02117 family protein [Comamonadaceae bacterium]